MKHKSSFYREVMAVMGIALLLGGITRTSRAEDGRDFLYVGDGYDNTVKRFAANTGAYTGAFVPPGSGGLDGPRGLIFTQQQRPPDTLLIANQNVDQDFPGEILAYNGATGFFLNALVPHTNPQAPFAPRGIVQQGVLFVAEFIGKGDNNPPGRLLAFTKNGKFLADLTPDPSEFPREQFHPRGVVVGPDGLLYVSNFRDLASGLGGHVLRFDPQTGDFKGVFIDSTGGVTCNCVNELNRPEGLVFGPDGNLYVTSFRSGTGDTDKILIFAGPRFTEKSPGAFLGKIPLDEVSNDPQARAFAQALLFGPEGLLYVPITGSGPFITGPPNTPFGYSTGAVRRYNVRTKKRVTPDFVLPFLQQGPLQQPWYLIFGKSDPATLAYREHDEELRR